MPQIWRGDAAAIRAVQGTAPPAPQQAAVVADAPAPPKKKLAPPAIAVPDHASPRRLPRLAWHAILCGLPGRHLTDAGLACRYLHGLTSAPTFMPHRRSWAEARRHGERVSLAAYPELLERLGGNAPTVAVPGWATSVVARKVWRVAVGAGSKPGLAQSFFLEAPMP